MKKQAKKTTKKTATKAKRPPRTVWVLLSPKGDVIATRFTLAGAERLRGSKDETVAGPYILAERVGNR